MSKSNMSVIASSISNRLVTLRTYILWFTATIIFLPLCLLLALLPASIRYSNRLYFLLTTYWSRLLIWATFAKYKIEGLENIPKTPAIFVMNHLSALDIPLLEVIVQNYPHIWVSRSEYAKIPLFGFLLSRMHVVVHKENPRESARALSKLINLASTNKSHVLLFPEGTRSTEGKLLPFHPGFAFITRKLNFPLIPVSICGSGIAVPKHSWQVNPSTTITIKVGKAFTIESFAEQEFIPHVRSWFEKSLGL